MKNFKTHLEENKILGGLAAFGVATSGAYAGSSTKPEALEIATTHIKGFEKFKSNAYVDKITTGKPLVIGYGITKTYPDGSPVKSTDRVTETQAHEHLKQHIDKHVLPKLEKIPGWADMDQHKQASLIGFAYNTGGGFYGTKGYATISQHLKNKDWGKVDDAMHLYNRSGGEVRNGLIRRRKMEAEMWNKNSASTSETPITEPVESSHHVVVSGDNLTKIANKYKTTVNDITAKNPDLKANPNKIVPGQKIRIK